MCLKIMVYVTLKNHGVIFTARSALKKSLGLNILKFLDPT